MKTKFPILASAAALILLSAVCVHAEIGDEAATALLDPALIPLYRDVVEGKPEQEIIGRKLDLSLHVRFCLDTLALFSGTHVVIDEDTKYYFIKWQFEPDTVLAILGKAMVPCRVQGTVIEVCRDETTIGMPYVIASLESVTLEPSSDP